MINELLTTLMEDTQFVDIMIADILDEGFFDKFKKKKEDSKAKDIDRSKLLSDTISIFKNELKKLKDKYPIKNSIFMTSNDEYYKDDKKSFIDGKNDSLGIAQYDLHKFSDKPRDTDENKKFWKYANEMINNVNKEISKYGAKVVADGDWDTGSFYLEIK